MVNFLQPPNLKINRTQTNRKQTENMPTTPNKYCLWPSQGPNLMVARRRQTHRALFQGQHASSGHSQVCVQSASKSGVKARQRLMLWPKNQQALRQQPESDCFKNGPSATFTVFTVVGARKHKGFSIGEVCVGGMPLRILACNRGEE